MLKHKPGTIPLFTLLLCLSAAPCAGSVRGVCSNCHTMHGSQGGLSMLLGTTSALQGALLRNTCVGCHTGSNTGGTVSSGTTPFVFNSTAPNYGTTGTTGDTLAGGNFYWVSQASGDPMGHNVVGIAAEDTIHVGNKPPGTADAGPWNQLTCAGTNGCHGDRTIADEAKAMHGGHHNDGGVVASGYRFLVGIEGLEDPEWEYTPTSTLHNQYKGVDRSLETDNTTTTMSSFCAKCHGNFHHGNNSVGAAFASPWLRHPTDFDMYNVRTKEYGLYNTDGSTYSVIAPLASIDVTSVISSNVLSASGKAIIMCLTCHRAHGSPYPSIMRWDYRSWPGGGYAGCQTCHTTKD